MIILNFFQYETTIFPLQIMSFHRFRVIVYAPVDLPTAPRTSLGTAAAAENPDHSQRSRPPGGSELLTLWE